MLRDLPLVLSIGRIRVIILIYDDDRFRITILIADDIVKDSDMLLRGISKCVVRPPVEASDHESLEIRGEMTLHGRREVEE